MRLSEALEMFHTLNHEVENFGYPGEIVDGLRDGKVKIQTLQEEKADIESKLKIEDNKEQRRELKARLADLELDVECAEISLAKFKSRLSERQAQQQSLVQHRNQCAKRLMEAWPLAPDVGANLTAIEFARLKTDELSRQVFHQERKLDNCPRFYRERYEKRLGELQSLLEAAKAEEQKLASESEARE